MMWPGVITTELYSFFYHPPVFVVDGLPTLDCQRPGRVGYSRE